MTVEGGSSRGAATSFPREHPSRTEKLRFCFQDGRAVGGKRLATSEREEENLAEEDEEEERLERPEAKKRKNSES